MEMLDQVHKVGKRTGASPIWRQDEKVVAVQPGCAETSQRLPVSEGALQRSRRGTLHQELY